MDKRYGDINLEAFKLHRKKLRSYFTGWQNKHGAKWSGLGKAEWRLYGDCPRS